MASALQRAHHEWTWDELAELPEQQRYEIVDGALVVSPPASLHDRRRSGVRPVPGGARWLHRAGTGRPGPGPHHDLVVVRQEAVRRGDVLAAPSDVLLVLEVLSASSVTTDRVTKRYEYATAGIPAYWWADPGGGPELVAHSGPDHADVQHVSGTAPFATNEPFTVQLVPATLLA